MGKNGGEFGRICGVTAVLSFVLLVVSAINAKAQCRPGVRCVLAPRPPVQVVRPLPQMRFTPAPARPLIQNQSRPFNGMQTTTPQIYRPPQVTPSPVPQISRLAIPNFNSAPPTIVRSPNIGPGIPHNAPVVFPNNSTAPSANASSLAPTPNPFQNKILGPSVPAPVANANNPYSNVVKNIAPPPPTCRAH